jgi:outer membrane autotransporter protein
VTGAATIAGTLNANDLGGSYTSSHIFSVLSSTGGLTGTFSSLTTTGSFGGAVLSLAYSPHEVFLIIAASGPAPPEWRAVPGSSDWNTATNWTTNTVPTATDIAQFNASTITTINIQQAGTQVGGLEFNAGAPAYTFNITGTSGVPSSLVIQGDGVADISGNAPTFVVSGVSGALGTLQFNNSSTADDAVIITNAFGQTIFSGNGNGGFARFITNAGGVVDFSGTSGPAGNSLVTAGSIEGAGTYNLGSNTLVVGLNGLSTTVSGSINDGGASGGSGASLVKVGGGTLTLSGASTYTGFTAVLGGTLQAGAANALASSSAFMVVSGATLDLASFNQTIGSLAGGGSVTLGSATLTTGNNNRSTTFSGTMSGSGGLTKVGSGTLTLAGSSGYSGATAVNAGTLQAGAANAFAASSAFTIVSGATLDLAGFNQTIGSLAGGGGVTLGSATLTTGNDNSSTTFSGTMSGTGGLAKIGSGALTLSGGNSYSGATIVNAGALQAGAANAFSASSAFAVGSGATLDLASFGQTIGSLAGAGNVTLGSATLTTGNDNTSTTFSGTISGVGGLTKIGAGTLTLAGANSYFGGTTIDAGTLAVSADNNLGNSSGSLAIGGGTLQYLAGFTSNRAVTLNAGGGIFDTNGNAATLGGSISGPGGLTKAGAGTLTLSGANTYAGATTINAGTLAVAADNNLGSGSGSLAFGGGTLQYLAGFTSNRAVTLNAGGGIFDTNGNNSTLAGTVSGSGGLTKIGNGTLTLSGSNSYSGATTINAGTLIVNGAIANSAVTVNSGAMLAGTGTVGTTTINSGAIFAPGNSPGTMTVQGNLAFQAGALYLVQMNPSTGSSANVTAGGSATLAGTVNAVFAAGSYVTRSYAIVSAAGGLGGAFSSLTTSNLPAGFTAFLSYTNTDAILNLSATLGQPSEPNAPGPPALSSNQQNVANALNNFFNSGGALPPAFVAIFGLTGSNLGTALSQLSGEAATGAQQVGFQMESQFLSLMLDPFVDGRSGIGGATGPALGFAPEREELPDEIALAYSSVLKAPAVPTFEQRWTAWGGAYGGGNRTSGDPAVLGSHDLSANTAGFAGGLDYHLSHDSVVGFALAGGGTNWSLSQGLGGGKSDAFQAGLYGATRWGAAYLAAAFAYTNHWMSTDRFAFAGDHLTASFNAQSVGGRIESGYRFAIFYGGVTPYAAIQAQNFHTPGYAETDTNGGGFALAYNSRSATDTRSELGARFDRLIAFYPGAALSLRARLAWAHDWVSDPSLAAVFQTLPGASFIVNGAIPAKDSALASAGAEYRLANGVTLLAKFDGEFAHHSSTYAGTGAVRYTW